MESPRWKQLLAQPEQLDPAGVDLAIIADGGDAAYRTALDRWNTLRKSSDRDAHAAIAFVLAEAFDDRRAMDGIATEWPEIFPEELAWRTLVQPATRSMREAFGPKALNALKAWLASDLSEELPVDAARIARTLTPDDDGKVYLETRRELVSRAEDKDAAELVADDLLVAVAAASPDRLEVRRTVLAYWGEEQPVDDVPTAEPAHDDAPASWFATCELIARSAHPAFADRVIEIASDDQDAWDSAGADAESLVRALGESNGETADAKLLEIAKAAVPVSGLAVRILAERRRRLSGAEPEMAARFDAIVEGMVGSGILTERPGKRTRIALANARKPGENPEAAAMAIAYALGRPTDDALAPEWSAFSSWLAETTLPEATPVPAAPSKPRSRGGFGRLFRKK